MVLGEHRDEDFKWADIVIRNPAIPVGNKYIQIAKQNGAQIFMDVSLFFSLVDNVIVGVTGTKGKSTTTMLIYEILKEYYANKKGINVYLAGNIGLTPIELLDILEPNDIVVLELSSFQLSVMGENKQSPHIAVITNIFTDHINWHKSFEHYLWSKLQIVEHQGKDDFLVLNTDNKFLKKILDIAKSHIIKVNLDCKKQGKLDLCIQNNKILHNGKPILDLEYKAKSLFGEHNNKNILQAVGATYLTDFNVDIETINKVIKNFKGAYGRQQYVTTINGIDFYNDTAATVDVAIFAAIDRFYSQYNNHFVLIMGGVDKGIDYEKVIKHAKNKVGAIVLLEGSASEKIMQIAKDMDIKVFGMYGDFKQAIYKAYDIAVEGANNSNGSWAVSLTPGAASFNMFLNEWDRGHKFDEIVHSLREQKERKN